MEPSNVVNYFHILKRFYMHVFQLKPNNMVSIDGMQYLSVMMLVRKLIFQHAR